MSIILIFLIQLKLPSPSHAFLVKDRLPWLTLVTVSLWSVWDCLDSVEWMTSPLTQFGQRYQCEKRKLFLLLVWECQKYFCTALANFHIKYLRFQKPNAKTTIITDVNFWFHVRFASQATLRLRLEILQTESEPSMQSL